MRTHSRSPARRADANRTESRDHMTLHTVYGCRFVPSGIWVASGPELQLGDPRRVRPRPPARPRFGRRREAKPGSRDATGTRPPPPPGRGRELAARGDAGRGGSTTVVACGHVHPYRTQLSRPGAYPGAAHGNPLFCIVYTKCIQPNNQKLTRMIIAFPIRKSYRAGAGP